MNLIKLETPEITTAVLDYASDQYRRFLPYYIFTAGTLGNNLCRCISNQKTGIASSFAKHQCFCSDAFYAMCEFQFPRSIENNLKEASKKSIVSISAPSICDVKRDFKDSNGVYQKSVCTVLQDTTYDNAATACANNGMTLLDLNSVELENYMFSYSNIQWPYGYFWYLGKTGTVCSLFSNDRSLFYFKTQLACTINAYFHCEYQSEF